MQVLENLLRLVRGLRLVFKRSQARRRGFDAGFLVFTSSSRQEKHPQENFDKATHAEMDKAASLPARTTTRGTTNQRSRKCSPPGNSYEVLDNMVSDLPSTSTLLVSHADKAALVMVSMVGVKVPAFFR
ncbi:hypothetical protein MRX96_029223 [Rhipicephalus microplus]